MRPQFDIDADLTLTFDGTDIPIKGRGDTIVIDLPSVAVGVRLLRQIQQHPEFKQLYALYNRSGDIAPVKLDVQIKGNTVATLNPEGKRGLVSRLTGNEGLNLEFTGLLKALFVSGSGDEPADKPRPE
jgi:hypothetical protein